MEAFISWLESELNKRDWTPSDLARKAGLRAASVTRVLDGTRNAGPDVSLAIARALNLPDVMVFRRAGLLSSKSEIEPEVEEAMHLFQQLEEDQREFVLRSMRAWLEDK